MKVKGILRGNTIELLEQVENLPSGSEITIEIVGSHPLSHLTPEERQTLINEKLGGWKDDPNLDQIFADIDQERHLYRGRQTDSFDD
ncbi:hypothetical protein NIES2104_62630 [Leptolyngbya sp. NIES-2104]|nr:hypothetical protein NIES2104_62630 [Leptolyngbya sp. NIES-2104]